MVSIDDTTCTWCTRVGFYLETVALRHRRDEIIQFFFQNIGDLNPKVYSCLVNGLTLFGKNADFVKFHPKICKNVMIHFGLTVFLSFCRPMGWTDNNSNIIEIETDVLVKALCAIMDCFKLDENCQELEYNKRNLPLFCNPFVLANSRFEVGKYIYENLIAKGFIDIVEKVLTSLKQNAQTIIPIHAKEFLDGLLNEGERSSIVSQFKDFFEAFLFKYGSIPTILKLCIPSTSTISSPNIIKVADKLLTGKLSAYLESSFQIEYESKTIPSAANREDGAYFVFWDDDYLEMEYIDHIAGFCLKHGLKSNNDKFLRTLYEQLVSERGDEESGNDDTESSLDDEKNGDDENSMGVANYTKVVFDDYPNDELGEDEDGRIIHICVRPGLVKSVYSEMTRVYPVRRTYSRLCRFLSHFMTYSLFGKITEFKRMAIIQQKMSFLYSSITPDQELSDSDDFDEYVG